MCDILNFLLEKGAHVSFGKENKADQLFPL